MSTSQAKKTEQSAAALIRAGFIPRVTGLRKGTATVQFHHPETDERVARTMPQERVPVTLIRKYQYRGRCFVPVVHAQEARAA